MTAAAKKLSDQFDQCSSVNDSCPTDTSGNIVVFNVAWFGVAVRQQYSDFYKADSYDATVTLYVLMWYVHCTPQENRQNFM